MLSLIERLSKYVKKYSSDQWRIQDFPEGGVPTPEGGAPTYYLANFSRKLHENKEILGPRGGRASLAPPPRSANADCAKMSNHSMFILFYDMFEYFKHTSKILTKHICIQWCKGSMSLEVLWKRWPLGVGFSSVFWVFFTNPISTLNFLCKSFPACCSFVSWHVLHLLFLIFFFCFVFNLADSENDSGYDPSQYSNSMPIGNRKSRASIEGFFDSIDKHINAKGIFKI